MTRLFLCIFFIIGSSICSAQNYEELIERSADYIEKNDYAAAEQVLKEAMRREPGNPANFLLLSNLGTVQRELGKYEEALLSYSAALVKQPGNVMMLHNRAALYCEMGRLEEAMREYNSILFLKEDDLEALYRRGLLYMDEKNLLAAEEDFEKIEAIKPTSSLSKMGHALILKKRGEWADAEEIYNSLLLKNRNQPDLFMNRGECYMNMQKLGKAQADFNKAQELGYENPFLYMLKGQLRLQQFDKFSAKIDFEKAKELGANPEVVDNFLKLCK